MSWQKSCDFYHSGMVDADEGAAASKLPGWLQPLHRWIGGTGPHGTQRMLISLLAGALVIIGLVIALILSISRPQAAMVGDAAIAREFIDRVTVIEKRLAQMAKQSVKLAESPPAVAQPQVKALETRIGEVAAQMAALRSQQQKLEKSVARVAKKSAPSAGTVASLAGQMETLSASVKQLQRQTRTLESKTDTLKASSSSRSKKPVTRTKAAQTHKVRAGETLFMIARRYNTSITKLRRYNNLSSKSTIYIGQRLVVRPAR